MNNNMYVIFINCFYINFISNIEFSPIKNYFNTYN